MKRSRYLGALTAFGVVVGTVAVAPAAVAGPDPSTHLAPVYEAPAGDDAVQVNRTPGAWFVELESAPGATGTDPATLRAERQGFRTSAERHGVDLEVRRTFSSLFHGYSIEMDSAEIGALRRTDGVKAIYPMVDIAVPTTEQGSPDMANALGMTGADVTQSELGFTGEGVRVAVMDTGIDHDHPDLGGSGFPGEKVVTGWDFVGDDYDASSSDPAAHVPHPDADPDDCQGHGTHVAGIIGASGKVTGVAPDAELGAYRVFGCEGSTTADIMIAAMERALADDMDVLNMSIGSAFSWPNYPTATAGDRLVDRGMSVVASIGNSGREGTFSAGAPGLGEKVIGVASFDNTHSMANAVTANPSGETVPYLPLGGAPEAPVEGTTDPLVDAGRACPSLGDEIPAQVAGSTALIVRGDCAFAEKYTSAYDAGATAVVIRNNVPGVFSGGGISGGDIPGIGIPQAEGEALLAGIEAGTEVTLTWTDDEVEAVSPTGGLISDFSSFGLSPDLALKPDLGAPGGNIFATYPLEKGGYSSLSGTSMAAPHVAGAVALLMQAHPGIRVRDIRDALQNSADPAELNIAPGAGHTEAAHRQGAGMLDIDDTVLAGAELTPGKISVGEGDGGSHRVMVRNTSDEPQTFTLSHTPAVATAGSNFAPEYDTAAAEVSFSTDSVTVAPGEAERVTVTVTAPEDDGTSRLVYGGYVVATSETGTAYSVPYGGYAGDYQAIDPIGPIVGDDGEIAMDLPGLGTLTSCAEFIEFDCIDEAAGYALQPDGATYSLGTVDGLPDIPYVLVHLTHQVERLQIEVLDAATGRPVDKHGALAAEVTGQERSDVPGAYQAFAWDGSYATRKGEKTVPNGDYVLALTALKAGGDPRDPEHWVTWQSPEITISRS